MKTTFEPTLKKLWRVSSVIALTGILLTQSGQSALAACANPAGVDGEQIYNSTHNTMQFCDGTDWTAMKGDGDTLSSLSCTDGQLAEWDNGGGQWICANAASGADNLGNHTATTALDMATSNKIINLADPTAAQDAATKAYVDTTAAAAADNMGNHTATQALKVGAQEIQLGTNNLQTITGNDAAAIFYDSNHSTVSQIQIRDLENTVYGVIYGSGDGASFGLLDGDGDWSYHAVKDTRTDFRINDTNEMRLFPTYLSLESNLISNVADPVGAQDAATKAYVDTNDADTLAGLSCADGQVAKWNNAGTNWICANDTGGGAGDDLGNHTATTALDLATNKITNLGTPTAGTDAATKAYVDTAAAAAADDLGDHEATQNIDLNTFKLVGNDGTTGIAIDALGNIAVDGTVDLGTDKIINVADPTAAQDAATKAYVDAQVGGGGIWTDLTGGRIHYGTSAANQVGIGTNNPTETLHVVGDILQEEVNPLIVMKDSSNTGTSSSLSTLIRFNGMDNVQAGVIGFDTGTGDMQLRTLRNNGMLFATNNANRMVIEADGDVVIKNSSGFQIGGLADTYVGELTNDSGILSLTADTNRNVQIGDVDTPSALYIQNDGDIGIGTVSPDNILHIDGGDITSVFVEYDDSVTGNGGMAFRDAAHIKWGIGPYSDSYATTALQNAFTINQISDKSGTAVNQNRFVVSNTGNIGIGTEAPKSKLHVDGDLLLTNSATTCGADQKGAVRLNASGDALEMCNGAGLWNTSGDTLSGLSCSDGQVASWNNGGSTWICSNNGSGAGDDLGNHTATTALSMATNKIINLGTPTAGTDATTKAYVDTAAAAAADNLGSGGTTTGTLYTTAQHVGRDAGDRITFGNNTNMQFDVNGTEEMRLSSAGLDLNANNIIDLADPTLAQHAATKAYVDAQVSGVGSDTLIDADSDTQIQVEEGADDDTIRFDTAGTERMVIDETGKIGIGLDPNYPLHILSNVGTAASTVFQRDNNTDDRADIAFRPDGALNASNVQWNVGIFNGETDWAVRRWDGTTLYPAIRLDSVTGYMGVNVSDPKSKLHVSGAIQIADDGGTCDANKAGAIRYNLGEIQYCNGTVWNFVGDNLGSGGTTTGTLYTTAQHVGRDAGDRITFGNNTNMQFDVNGTEEMRLSSAGLDLNANNIIDLADPTAAQHAATKNYVDTQVSSGGDDLGDHTATTALDMADQNIDDVNTLSIGSAMTLHDTNAVATGPDIQFDSAGLLAAESGVYINIDSNNDTTSATFLIKKDAATSAGATIFTVAESGTATATGDVYATGQDIGRDSGDRITFINNSRMEFDVNGAEEMRLSSAGLDLNANNIIDLADPTAAQDAATKAYVDAQVGGASDADTLDSLDSLQFLRADANDATTGQLGVGNADIDGTLTVTGAPSDISSANAAGDGAIVIQGVAGDATGNKLRIDSNEMQASADGAASFLRLNTFGGDVHIGTAGNADLNLNTGSITNVADPTAAQDAATKAYVDATVSGASDADTVDSLHAASFIRSDANDNVSGHTEWQDSMDVRLGTGADFRMMFNATDTYMSGYSHGSRLIMRGEDTGGTMRTMILADPDNYVRLYHGGATKLQTASNGVAITGKVTGLTDPTAAQDAATKAYVDAQVLSGGADNLGNHTATTALDMATTNKIINLANPTAAQDAATKTYVDTAAAAAADNLGSGGTTAGNVYSTNGNVGRDSTDRITFINSTRMEFDVNGVEEMRINPTTIDMQGNRVIDLGAPTAGTDAATKAYVDAQIAGTGDDLGDHTATTTLLMGANNIALGTSNLQTLSGNDAAAMAYDSNHSTSTQMQFRDLENTVYGSVYGSGDGGNFGLLDGDGNWSYLAQKDSNTQFRINNVEEMRISPTTIDMQGNRVIDIGAPTAGTDATTKTYVDAAIAASGDDLGAGGTTAGNIYATGQNIGRDSSDRLTFVNNTRIEFDVNGVEKMRLLSNGLDMQANRIYDLGAPTAATDAATKAYVDALVPASATNADTVDGLHAASFLRSDADDSTTGNLAFTSGNGKGLKFWNSDSYKIYMSQQSDATWGGRLDTTSDYNMYFRMTGGTNRGFVFQNATTELAQIDAAGTVYATKFDGIFCPDGSATCDPLTNEAFTAAGIGASNIYAGSGGEVDLQDNINFNSNIVTGVPTPTSNLHAANKAYVDAEVAAAPGDNLGAGGTTAGDVYATGQDIGRDSGDRLTFINNSRIEFDVNGVEEARLTATRMDINGNDLYDANNIYAVGSFYYGDAKEMFDFSDAWLRLNQNGDFTAGTYTPGLIRADGGFQVDSKVMINSTGSVHTARYADDTRYGYFEGRNNSNVRGFYLGYGNGGNYVQLQLDAATNLKIGGGYLDMESNQIRDVGAPTSANHAATKTYVDNYVPASATNADTVDSLHAASFIRADANDNVSGHTEWQDGYEARFGTDADFRIEHDGTNHIIRGYKHGTPIYVQAENAGGTNRTMIFADPDNSVRLYYTGTERARTTGTGMRFIPIAGNAPTR